ncbi:uncharacterized protein LOC143062652 isoform X1 [Mytilus galloprovincialis]|uniref:uncharacterized protein LOC143062652 isoform X1 n=2 Tax=Mytilus galloprovincialis TaxID=29158 RepID=UPI003F7C777A
MSYNYQESLNGEALSRYQCKLDLISCKECPYKLPAGVWQNNPCKWPDVQWGDVYSYLIDSPGVYTRESMKAFKSLEAHNFFISGWVQTVFHYLTEKGAPFILKADVKPSQRVNEDPHHPWVAVNSSGTVVAAHCDCMAGLSEVCSHVAALLFKIEAAGRLGYTRKACTEEPCKWNADFVKKVLPDPISKIKFYKASTVLKAKSRKRNRTRKFTPANDNQKQQLLDSLKGCTTKPIVLCTFNGYSTDFHWTTPTVNTPKIPAALKDWYHPDNIKLSIDELYDKCKGIADSMTISYEVTRYIYDCTTAQSSSMTWYDQRVGRITSSTVHNVLHTTLENPSTSLLKKICDPAPKPLNVPAVIWGREHEKSAIKEFQQVMCTDHQNFCVKKAGFLIDLNYPYIGVSADGIATCDCHGSSVLEVKCPYKYRSSLLPEFLADPNTCLKTDHELKKTHQYYSQVQLQMYVHNMNTSFFVVWGEKFTVVSNVTKDDEFIKTMLEKSHNFFINAVVPELLTRKISSPTEKPISNDELFCICQTPEDGNMIGCDNQNCKYKWFHLDCIKMKRVPKFTWYCSYCKKQ